MSAIPEPYLFRIQTDPNVGENPVATALFGERAVIDGVAYEGPIKSYSWSLHSQNTVTVRDVTLTYAQVSEFVVAIAYQEKSLQDAAG